MRHPVRLPAWIALLDLPLARRRGLAPLSLGRALLRAGVPCLRLRAPAAETRGVIRLARLLAGEARQRGVPLLIGHDPALLRAAGVDGMVVSSTVQRPPLPRAFLVGANLHAAQRQASWVLSADFVVVAPVWAPSSKAARRPALGVDGLQTLLCRTRAPAYALGGVRPDRWPALAAAGVWGPAVLGPLHVADPAPLVDAWNRLLQDHRRG